MTDSVHLPSRREGILLVAAFIASLILARGATAGMVCWMGQEPDPSMHGRYRWVIPEPDPCKCTEVRQGGLNTKAPCRSFNVTYYDSFFQASDPQEIRRLLKCPDPCTSAPCQNGGNCTLIGDGLTYTCSCPVGFTGTNCNITDLCTSAPCQNGGNCTLTVDGLAYNCSCPMGFIGTTCNISDPCVSDVCDAPKNVCRANAAGDLTCECPEGLTGDDCQDRVSCRAYHRYGDRDRSDKYISPACGHKEEKVFCDNLSSGGGWMWLYGYCKHCWADVCRPEAPSVISCPDQGMPVTGFAVSDKAGFVPTNQSGWILDETVCTSLTAHVELITELAGCKQLSAGSNLTAYNVLVEGQCDLGYAGTGCDQETDGTVQAEIGVRFDTDWGTFELACYTDGARVRVETWPTRERGERSVSIRN